MCRILLRREGYLGYHHVPDYGQHVQRRSYLQVRCRVVEWSSVSHALQLCYSYGWLGHWSHDWPFGVVLRYVYFTCGSLCLTDHEWKGTGKGDPGTPYGIAASAAVFIPIIVFLRVYAPIKYIQGMILAGATFALVVGYSWIDGHLPQLVTPGLGWGVAWRRAMTVFVGMFAIFLHWCVWSVIDKTCVQVALLRLGSCSSRRSLAAGRCVCAMRTLWRPSRGCMAT